MNVRTFPELNLWCHFYETLYKGISLYGHHKNVRNLRMLFFKNKPIVMLRNNVKLFSDLVQKFEPTIVLGFNSKAIKKSFPSNRENSNVFNKSGIAKFVQSSRFFAKNMYTYVLGLVEIFILAKKKNGVPVFVLELFCEKVVKKFSHLEYCLQTGYKQLMVERKIVLNLLSLLQNNFKKHQEKKMLPNLKQKVFRWKNSERYL